MAARCDHTYLEWFLSGVDANVPGELVRPAEPPVALVNGAFVRAFLKRGLRRPLYHLPHVRHSVDDGLVRTGRR